MRKDSNYKGVAIRKEDYKVIAKFCRKNRIPLGPWLGKLGTDFIAGKMVNLQQLQQEVFQTSLINEKI